MSYLVEHSVVYMQHSSLILCICRDSEETVRWKAIRKRGWKLDNQINNDIKTSR